MTRADFQRLADERLQDAEILLAAKRWSGAYYLAGYSIECALKACICKQRRRFEAPDKKLAEKFFTHQLIELVAVAGLKEALDSERQSQSKFSDAWNLVRKWNEGSRYVRNGKSAAEELVRATASEEYGLLPWLRQRW